MNTIVSLGIGTAVLGAAIVLQWTVLRTKYRNEATKRHTRYEQQLQTASQHIQQAKRQIGQLQHDLAAARLQIKRLAMVAAAPVQSDSQAKKTPQRPLDESPEVPRHLPTDGFADTRPFRHSEHARDLLLR